MNEFIQGPQERQGPQEEVNRTPTIRRYLQKIRRAWVANSEQNVFLFTKNIENSVTIESFCIEFVLSKYM